MLDVEELLELTQRRVETAQAMLRMKQDIIVKTEVEQALIYLSHALSRMKDGSYTS